MGHRIIFWGQIIAWDAPVAFVGPRDLPVGDIYRDLSFFTSYVMVIFFLSFCSFVFKSRNPDTSLQNPQAQAQWLQNARLKYWAVSTKVCAWNCHRRRQQTRTKIVPGRLMQKTTYASKKRATKQGMWSWLINNILPSKNKTSQSLPAPAPAARFLHHKNMSLQNVFGRLTRSFW